MHGIQDCAIHQATGPPYLSSNLNSFTAILWDFTEIAALGLRTGVVEKILRMHPGTGIKVKTPLSDMATDSKWWNRDILLVIMQARDRLV